MNEWIFDDSSALRLHRLLSPSDRARFPIDVTKLSWKMYLMNYAYGIKKFILKEEAELPSVGYNDAITLMSSKHDMANFIPYYYRGKLVKVRPMDEMKKMVLESEDVKEVIVRMVKKRTQQFKQRY